jgi:1-acyl-sn-glycerol-3-phosphate acyltransferase
MAPVDNEAASPPDAVAGATRAQQLLLLVRDLSAELHPGDTARLTLDSHLERDAGIDSLARIELLARIEHDMQQHVAERDVLSAASPRELLAAMGISAPLSLTPLPQTDTTGYRGVPTDADTLVEMFAWHVEQHADRVHLQLYESDDRLIALTYRDMWEAALSVAGGLRDRGVAPHEAVALMLPTGREFFAAFYGCLLAGAVPTPLYPPYRLSQLEDHLHRQVGILANAEARLLITDEAALPMGPLLKGRLPDLLEIVTPATLASRGRDTAVVHPAADDPGLLQYTSGSTAQPKGVTLSHANLLANIRCMGRAAQANSDDVFVSWLPLYHDMGLIGACLGTLYHAIPLVLMSPLAFIARPQRWFAAITRHRGTLSAAPNFAYDICLNKLDDAALAGIDLGSWRMAFNGAEPVNPATVEAFCARFAAQGFRRGSMAPVYGLAECCVGLAFPPLDRGPRIDTIDRQRLARTGRAEPVARDAADAMAVVGCGMPLPGHEIRIVDSGGIELGEREVGHIQFRGPSTTRGYYRNPEASAALFDGAWLNAGDKGYIANGEIHITGRVKDLIIRAGRNLFPYELEQAVGKLPGILPGNVAVFASPDPVSHGDRLVVLAETRVTDATRRDRLRAHIEQLGMDLLQTPPDDIVLAPPRTILKTSSGKIRRGDCREQYQRGMMTSRHAVWRQVAGLAIAGLPALIRRAGRRINDRAYGVWCRSILTLTALPTWLILVLLPKRTWRRGLARGYVHTLLKLCGIDLTVYGSLPDNMPACVLAANHISYLDGFIIFAALKCDFDFVAKRELTGIFFARKLLDAIGAAYVERHITEHKLRDVNALAGSLRAGRSLMFFPEGTFTRAPGLLPFNLGAFRIAAEHGVPIVPVIITGTRSILRGDDYWPRRGSASVTIAAPILPEGNDWRVAVSLRARTREVILANCGEPDLGHQITPPPEA